MKRIAFLEKNVFYVNAIKRYLKFIFGTKFEILDNHKRLRRGDFVFIDENISMNEGQLEFFIRNSDLGFIVLGSSFKSDEIYINLLDLSHLKPNIDLALNQKHSNFSPFLYIESIRSKIKILFKGHGKKSLFGNLNMARNDLSNYPLLYKRKKLRLSWNDYNEQIKTGVKNWSTFKDRFYKYEIYLRVCGFDREINKIKRNMYSFDNYIKNLVAMNSNQLSQLNEKEIKLNNIYIEEIDNELGKMKNKIESIYDFSEESSWENPKPTQKK
jgi:hypothetical protein